MTANSGSSWVLLPVLYVPYGNETISLDSILGSTM